MEKHLGENKMKYARALTWLICAEIAGLLLDRFLNTSPIFETTGTMAAGAIWWECIRHIYKTERK